MSITVMMIIVHLVPICSHMATELLQQLSYEY